MKMHKICYVCKEIKGCEDFYKNPKAKDGLANICKECHKARMHKRSITKKDEISKYHKEYATAHKEDRKEKTQIWRMKIQGLKTPCVKCGEDRPCVIEFHHINPKDKLINIGKISPRKSFDIIENEVKKCVCLCKNCHFEFHSLYGIKPTNPEKSLVEYLSDCYDLSEVIKYF